MGPDFFAGFLNERVSKSWAFGWNELRCILGTVELPVVQHLFFLMLGCWVELELSVSSYALEHVLFEQIDS